MIILVDVGFVLVNLAYAGELHYCGNRIPLTMNSVRSIAHVRTVRHEQAYLHSSARRRPYEPVHPDRMFCHETILAGLTTSAVSHSHGNNRRYWRFSARRKPSIFTDGKIQLLSSRKISGSVPCFGTPVASGVHVSVVGSRVRLTFLTDVHSSTHSSPTLELILTFYTGSSRTSYPRTCFRNIAHRAYMEEDENPM